MGSNTKSADNLLLVNDDVEALEAIASKLDSDARFLVRTARSSDRAIAIARSKPIDLVVLYVSMKGRLATRCAECSRTTRLAQVLG
jgi:DNA-binding response OmpR family regulator